MANLFDEVSIKGLRATHFEQLESYMNHATHYYGNRKQFFQRDRDLRDWLENIIRQARDKNNIIPK